MKKSNKFFFLTLVIILALMLLAFAGLRTLSDAMYSGGCPVITNFFHKDSIVGNGKIVTSTVLPKNFDKVNLNGRYDVTIQAGKENSVQMQVDENLLSYQKITVSGGELNIGSQDVSLSPSEPIKVLIQVATPIHEINLGGKTTLDIKNIKTDRLVLSLGGKSLVTLQAEVKNLTLALGGKSEAHVSVPNAESITLDAGGNATVNLSGITKTLNVSGAGKMRLNAAALAAEDVQISSAGKSDVTVHAIKNLSVSSMGDSRVIYYGNPVVDKSGFGKM